jgi:hypothetical protein
MTEDEKKELKSAYVSLQYHFERILEEREKQMNQRFESVSKILEATAKELAHRLEVLNHAHDQQIEDRNELVKKSEYDIKTSFYDEWCRGVDAALTEMRTKSVTWTLAIGLFITIVVALIETISHFWKSG